MWFGGDKESSDRVGNPPPMVFLNGYGTHYFPNVPCVITSFQHTMPADVDYISAVTNTVTTSMADQSDAETRRLAQKSGSSYGTKSDITMIPTTSSISVTLQPIYSRKNVYNNSNLDKFAKGELIGNASAGKGGFI